MKKAVYLLKRIIRSAVNRTKVFFLTVFFRIKEIKCIIKCIWLLHYDRMSNAEVVPLENYYSNNNENDLSIQGFRYNICLYDLSIIIPIYNASDYIESCMESVINQVTSFSYEVIIIDDGSTDNSVDIIKRYLINDRIRLFQQDNSGQSVARNIGLYNSLGKYLMFVDADDVLLNNAVELLLQAALKSSCDIVEGSFVTFYDKITKEMICASEQKDHIESYNNNPFFVLSSFGYAWAKVYRRDLWSTLRFPEGYIFEDIITKFILRRNANRVVYIKDVVYGYRMNNPNSSSHKTGLLKKLDSIWILPKVIKLCDQEGAPRDEVLYMLALNHIGLLNYITVRTQTRDVKLACFIEMRKQLVSIQDCRPNRIPWMFRLLERSIFEKKYNAWEYIAATINKYNMLKKWREID